MEIRPRPQQIDGWAKQTGLLEPLGTALELPPWHYGLRFQRKSNEGNNDEKTH